MGFGMVWVSTIEHERSKLAIFNSHMKVPKDKFVVAGVIIHD